MEHYKKYAVRDLDTGKYWTNQHTWSPDFNGADLWENRDNLIDRLDQFNVISYFDIEIVVVYSINYTVD